MWSFSAVVQKGGQRGADGLEVITQHDEKERQQEA